MNYRALLKTTLLALVFVYVFATLGFLFFSDLFVEGQADNDPKAYGNNIYLALSTTANLGLRYNGGIGDVLKQPILGYFILKLKYFLNNYKNFILKKIDYLLFSLCLLYYK